MLDVAAPRRRPEPHPAAADGDARRLAARRPRAAPRAARAGPRARPAARRARAQLGARPQGGDGRAARRDRAQGAGGDLAGRRAPRRAGARAGRRCSTSATPLHAAAGRGTDRVAPELWPTWRAALGLPDADAPCSVHVRALGRRITHLSRLTWRRVDAVLRRAGPPRRAPAPAAAAARRRPASRVALRGGRARPGRPPAADPLLLLRAAAEAASATWCSSRRRPPGWSASVPPLPEPWPAEARDLLVRLLAAGPRPAAVWETLDETDALDTPARVGAGAAAPARLPVHRFTVDRHLVETCIEAVGADPAGVAARRADGRRAAARHRQGRAHRALRGRRADRPRRSPAGWASTSATSS